MLDLKNMGFEMDFPAMKLKAGSGEPVCRVLLFLADHVSVAGSGDQLFAC